MDDVILVGSKVTDTFILQQLVLWIVVLFSFLVSKVKTPNTKKWLGTVFGTIIVLLALKTRIYKVYLVTIVTIVMVVKGSPKYCHIVASGMMFSFITAFRLTEMSKKNDVNVTANLMYMTLIFSVVGVAFEKNLAYRDKKNNKVPIGRDLTKLSFMDIWHYTFHIDVSFDNPYVTYAVFEDHINLPYCRAVPKKKFFMVSLVKLVFFFIASLYLASCFGEGYVHTAEYASRSLIFKNFFSTFIWLVVRSIIYSNFAMSGIHLAISGLGAYPVALKNKSAYGPTETNMKHFELMTEAELRKIEFDFETVKQVDILPYETTLTITSATRMWNKPPQYWMFTYIYKNISKNKVPQTIRIFLTLLTSGLWHGTTFGIYLTAVLTSVYMPAEKPLWKFYQRLSGWRSLCCGIFMWILKSYMYGNLVTPFIYNSRRDIFAFYSSVYYAPLFVVIGLHILNVTVLKRSYISQPIKSS